MHPSSAIQHIRHIHQRQRPTTSHQQTHDIVNGYHNQAHGKMLFKENFDQQIPNLRYMSPIFPQFSQQNGPSPLMNFEVRNTTTRCFSAQSLNMRNRAWKI
jgi:hypothetical protein